MAVIVASGGQSSDSIGDRAIQHEVFQVLIRQIALQFNPPELRHVYVCEFKRLAGESYRKILLQYFDSYRECFDVSVRGENEYVIFPNKRTSRLGQRKSTFLCACSGLADR
jgi:hypothetical protein